MLHLGDGGGEREERDPTSSQEFYCPILASYSSRTMSSRLKTRLLDTRSPVLAGANQSEPSVVLVSGKGASEHDSFNGACNAKIVTPPPSVDGISAVGRVISGMHLAISACLKCINNHAISTVASAVKGPRYKKLGSVGLEAATPKRRKA